MCLKRYYSRKSEMYHETIFKVIEDVKELQ